MTMANPAATAQRLPQMGLPSEMPKYENRLVWYRVAAVSSNPVASAKKAFISSRVPRPCVTRYAPAAAPSSDASATVRATLGAEEAV